MATCCKSNSTCLIFAVLVVWLCDVGRVAVKHCFKLLSFYIYIVKYTAAVISKII